MSKIKNVQPFKSKISTFLNFTNLIFDVFMKSNLTIDLIVGIFSFRQLSVFHFPNLKNTEFRDTSGQNILDKSVWSHDHANI